MKIKHALIGLLLLGITSAAFSGKIDAERAKHVAKNFLYEKTNQYRQPVTIDAIVITGTYTEMNGAEATYYVFNMQDGGFVIVSADDVITPVLGYAFTGSYVPDKTMDNHAGWMKHYSDMVVWARETGYTAESSTLQEWDRLLTNDPSGLTGRIGRDIAPLIRSTWDQGAPYNVLCPEVSSGGSGGHVWTGCVATAMAQIMYHWRYPISGSGTHTYNCQGYGILTADFENTTYDWNAMLNAYNTGSPEQSIYATALLQYHAGIAVNMQYGPNGSGSQSYLVPPALKNYFNYSSSTTYTERSGMSQSNWENVIMEDIDNGWPLYYSGNDGTVGHAFVCDGYQLGTPNYFHFNFGWSGNSDGYYTVNNPAGFSYGQAIVQNIYPDDEAYTYPYFCNGPATINTTSGTVEDGSGPLAEYENNIGCSWLIQPKETDSVEHYTISFVRFNTQSTDILHIYDGETTDAPLLLSHSGDQLPANVQSSGPKVLVTFTTDGDGTAPGWFMTITPTLPDYCVSMTTLSDPDGSFGDGSGNKNYLEGSLCRWKIDVDNASHITVNFTSFDLEPLNDFVQILDLSTNPPTELGTFSGPWVPGDVTGAGPLMIVFLSDEINNRGGFTAEYYSDFVGIDENEGLASLTLYPNPVSNVLNIQGEVLLPQELEISLMNITGAVVYTSSRYQTEGPLELAIDISSLPNGVYVLKVTGNEVLVTERVLIQK
jgi:hypothetical protein